MANYTRRRSQQAGSLPFFATPDDDSIVGSEARINAILTNVKTTTDDLQKELKVYYTKMATLETEFNQYQRLATKVMAAIDVLQGTSDKLTGESPAENATTETSK
jgi:septal ring factor EnvC (AmiA/AmiB activator)